MGDLLKDWVQSTVKHELKDGLEWLRHKSIKSVINNNSRFEDDGSNLRIKVTRSGVVQIVKFTAFEEPEPIQAEISDSFTRVKVTFAASAVEKFNLEERKSITRDTLGSLIQILDFEIVATHIGPRTSRLTILIKDFQILGSEGSGVFSFPRPIENMAGIVELLDELKSFRENESSRSQKERKEDNLARSSVTKSLGESTFSNDENSELCDQGFATQVHHSWHNGRALVKEIKSSNPNSPTRLKNPPKLDTHAKASTGNSANSIPTSFKENKTALPNPKSGVSLRSPKRTQLRHIQPKAIGNQDIKAQDLLSLLPGYEKTKSITPSKTTSIPARPVQTATSVYKVQTDSKKGLKAFKKKAEFKQEVNVVEAPSDLAQNNENPEQDVQVSSAHDVVVAPKVPLEPIIDKVTLPTVPQPSSPIKEKEVKILKDQKFLLERSDCWIPAEPGQREPVAHIPIKTLQVISEQAENGQREFSKTNQLHDQSQNRFGPQASQLMIEHETDSNEDSEPDVPIPSEEWPPSSPSNRADEELPPDSSAEASKQADRFYKGEISKEEPISKRRKLSSTSAASHSTTTSRKGSVQESNASKSSTRSSPVSASSLAEKGSRIFKNATSGRDQSHLKPQGSEHFTSLNHQIMKLRADESNTKSEASIVTWDTCTRCHKHFDSPGGLFQHENNSRCVADSSQALRSLINSDSSPIFANISTQTLIDNKQDCSKNDDESQYEGDKPEIEECSVSLDLPAIQPEAQVKSAQKDSNQRPSLSLENPLKAISSDAPHDSSNDSSNDYSRIMIESNSTNLNQEPDTLVSEVPMETEDIHGNDTPMRNFPSTASQPEEPILQVKRTPYVNGCAPDTISMDPVSDSSPAKAKSVSVKRMADGAKLYQTSTKPVMFDISSDEALSDKHSEDLSPRKKTSNPSLESPQSMDLDLINQQVQNAIDTQSKSTFISSLDQQTPKTTDSRFSKSRSECFVEEYGSVDIENAQMFTASENEGSYTGFTQFSPLSSEMESVKTKRKQSETAVDSPHNTKRRKRPTHKISFDFSQNPHFMADPSVLGTKHRQDFFNSRKQSMTDFERERRLDPSSKIATSPLSSQAEVEHDGMLARKLTGDASITFLSSPPLGPKSGKSSEIDGSARPTGIQHLENINSEFASSSSRSKYEGKDPQRADKAFCDEKSDIFMDNTASHEVKKAQEQFTLLPPMEVIFDRFKIAYPGYHATLVQFIAICKRIKKLVETDHMEHPSLWDDFIIRHKTEYPIYLRRCVDNAEDPVPYERFYRNEIAKPEFFSRVVTPKTLHEAFLLETPIDVRVSPQHDRKVDDSHENRNSVQDPESATPKSKPKRPGIEKSCSPRTIVDLTGDHEASPAAKKNTPLGASEKKSSRPIPWLNLSERSSVKNRNIAHSSQPLSKSLSSSPQIRMPKPSSAQAPKSPNSSPSKSIIHRTSPVAQRATETRGNERFPNDINLGENIVPPKTPNSAKVEQEILANAWWKDHNTQFTRFARAYTAIRSGNGNSYATAESSKSASEENLPRAGTFGPILRRIDITKWRL